VLSARVTAHHSALIFDRDLVVAFQGTVTRFNWTNPHVYIYVETRADTGELVEWEIETDATPILIRSGWAADSLVSGDIVSVRANPDRNSARRHALLVSVAKGDGAVLAARSNFLRRADATDSTAAASSLSGFWELGFADYTRFAASWPLVPSTTKGAASQAGYDIKSDSPEAQCVALPSPGLLAAPYLNEIEIHADSVVFRNERFNVERIVYMDGRGHPENGERSNQGHSIGWWEDGTLVVDTTLFTTHRSQFLGSGLPSGPDKHVVERYDLSDDGSRIVIEFRLDDPEYLAEPFTGTLSWYYAPHFDMLGFACDPEVSSRYSIAAIPLPALKHVVDRNDDYVLRRNAQRERRNIDVFVRNFFRFG
jgi:hypothetical protein